MKGKKPIKVEWCRWREWSGWLSFPERDYILTVLQRSRGFDWHIGVRRDYGTAEGSSRTLAAAKLACVQAVQKHERAARRFEQVSGLRRE
jgi:hypothetical protein